MLQTNTLQTQNLIPHVKQIVGIDISPNMVQVYNKKQFNQGILDSQMHAYSGDIFQDAVVQDLQSLVPNGFADFDAAVCSLAYHHISDIEQANIALLNSLRKGGWVFIVDLAQGSLEEGGTQPPDENDHHHSHDHHHGHDHGHTHSHGHSHTHGNISSGMVPHRGGFTSEILEESLKKCGFVNVQSKKAFTVRLWADDASIRRFALHHGDSEANTDELRHGMRVFDTRILDNGETRYLVKKKMMLVVGQRPL